MRVERDKICAEVARGGLVSGLTLATFSDVRISRVSVVTAAMSSFSHGHVHSKETKSEHSKGCFDESGYFGW